MPYVMKFHNNVANISIIFIVKYYVSEVMNLVNVVAQYFFTDYFLGGNGRFMEVGLKGLSLDEHMSILPILGSCKFDM